MLAVEVDYEAGTATIGTQSGSPVPKAELLAALKSIGYRGTFAEEPDATPISSQD